MENASDYLYLIIAFIAIISGLARKAAKKQPSSTPATNKKSWEDVLRELVPVEAESPTTPPLDPIQEKKESQPPTKIQRPVFHPAKGTLDIKPKTQVKEELLMTSPDLKLINTTELSDEQEGIPFSLNSPEEARKAFISSEIFRRKYF